MIKINSKLFMESAKELKLKTNFNITLVIVCKPDGTKDRLNSFKS